MENCEHFYAHHFRAQEGAIKNYVSIRFLEDNKREKWKERNEAVENERKSADVVLKRAGIAISNAPFVFIYGSSALENISASSTSSRHRQGNVSVPAKDFFLIKIFHFLSPTSGENVKTSLVQFRILLGVVFSLPYSVHREMRSFILFCSMSSVSLSSWLAAFRKKTHSIENIGCRRKMTTFFTD